MMGRFSESLKQLKHDLEQEHEIDVQIAIMDEYAEMYEVDDIDRLDTSFIDYEREAKNYGKD